MPSEVVVGVEEGLKADCAVNLDHVQTVDKARLHRYVGSLSATKMAAVCEALAIATGCDTVTTAGANPAHPSVERP